MSKTVDERVVEMKFDNKEFEQNVKTSMSTLDKLKSALKLDGVSKGLEEVDKSARKIDMNPLSNGIETVQAKFSAMQVVAMTALMNITNSAIEAGKNLVNAFAIEPIKDGFQEYELLMDSVKTIQASTGESIGVINQYLDELNTYADKTIYTFSDMTSSIGKFTNSGVDLERAVKAIQGISNEAAVSGANAEQASHAMYNFAQALSSGAVKLIDWKSIENANMATVEFKDTLIQTGLALGTVVQVGDKYQTTTTNAQGKVSELFDSTYKFNDALQNQWMTSEVLIQALELYSTDVSEMSEAEKKAYEEKLRGIGYTDEQIKNFEELGIKANEAATKITKFSQLIDVVKEAVGSGWAQTFRILIGDFEESKELWTEVGNVITGYVDKVSQARNETAHIFKVLGGREAIINSIKNVYQGLLSVITPIKDAFNEIFPPMAPRHIVAIAKAIEEFTTHLKASDTVANNINRTFRGVFAAVHIVATAITSLLQALFPMSKSLSDFGGGFLNATANIGDWLVALDKSITEGNVFAKAFQSISDTVGPIFTKITDGIGKVINAIKDFATTHFKMPDISGFEGFFNKVDQRVKPFTKIIEIFKAAFNSLVGVIQSVMPFIGKVGAAIGKVFGDISDAILTALNGGGFSAMIDLINGGLLVSIGAGIMKFIKNLTGLQSVAGEGLEGMFSSFSGIGDGIKSVLGGAQESLENIQGSIKADTLQKIATAVGILAASLVAISMVDSDKLTTSLGAVSSLLVEVAGAMAILNKLMGGTTFIEGGIGAHFNGLIDSFSNSLSTMAKAQAISKVLISFAAAIVILALALKMISSIEPDRLADAMGVLTGLITELTTVSVVLTKFNGDAKIAAGSLVIFAAAIGVLTLALAKIASIDPARVGNAMGIMTGLITELATVSIALTRFNGKASMGAGGLLIFAAAIGVLTLALAKIASIDPARLGGSIATISILIGELAASSILISRLGGNLSKNAVGFIAFAGAIYILSAAVEKFAAMKPEETSQGLKAMGIALAEFVAASLLMGKADHILSSAAALLIMSGAITIIGNVITKLGSLNWDDIARGLVAMGGALLEIILALQFAKGTMGSAASLLVMSAALTILGGVLQELGSMSWAEIAKGLVALGGALAIVGIAGVALAPVVPAILALAGGIALLGVACLAAGAGVLMFSAGLAALAVSGVAGAATLVTIINTLIVGVIGTITNSAEAIATCIKTLVLIAVDVFKECVPALVDGALVMILEVLNSLAQNAPAIVSAMGDLIIGLINALGEKMPAIVEAISNFIQPIVEKVKEIFSSLVADPTKLMEMVGLFGMVAAFMIAASALTSLLPGALAGVAAAGVVIAEMSLVLAAIGALNKIPGLQEFINGGGELLQSIGTAIGRFVGGFVGGVAEGIFAQLPQMAMDLSQFMVNLMPFIMGAKMIKPEMMDGVAALAGVVLALTAADILNGIASFFGMGGSSLAKFGQELSEFGPYIKKFSDDVKDVNPEAVQGAANAAKAMAEMAKTLPNNGGLAGKIFGENSLAEFGQELESFGPHIATFAEQVKDVKPEAVEGAAQAAQIMADMATKLPNNGGLAGKIFGENPLSAFGEELESFGPHIAAFAEQVKDVKPESVQGAADAATIMSEMASELPESGGLIQRIFGEKPLSEFGKELVKFGVYISEFGNEIVDLPVEAVTAAGNAAKVLAELANNIPNTGGLVSIFTGDNTLDTFGDGLKSFGQALAAFGQEVAGLVYDDIYNAIACVRQLIHLGQDMTTLDTSVYSQFAYGLNEMATNAIIQFCSAFNECGEQVTAAVNTLFSTASAALVDQGTIMYQSGVSIGSQMDSGLAQGIADMLGTVTGQITVVCNTILSTFRSLLPAIQFNTIAQNQIMNAIIQGIKSRQQILLYTIKQLCLVIIQEFKTGLPRPTFLEIGRSVIQAISDGITDPNKKRVILSYIKLLCNEIVQTFKNAIQSQSKAFYDIGNMIDEGLAKGIRDNSSKVEKAMADVIKAAVAKGRKEAKIESPSKVFAEIGRYMDLGLARGIKDNANEVINETASLADSAIYSMRSAIAKISDTIDSDMDLQPTITPVVDLSNIQNGSKRINSILSRGINLSMPYYNALSAAGNQNYEVGSGGNSRVNNVSNNYNFTQNNYSPKALSRSEIYRQTKNQFSQLKGAVSGI